MGRHRWVWLPAVVQFFNVWWCGCPVETLGRWVPVLAVGCEGWGAKSCNWGRRDDRREMGMETLVVGEKACVFWCCSCEGSSMVLLGWGPSAQPPHMSSIAPPPPPGDHNKPDETRPST